jgi:uncharacterized protein (TIGR02145 family)
MHSFLLHANHAEPDETGKVPQVETVTVTGITATTATSGGKSLSDKGSAIEEKGICWSTAENPTIDDEKTMNGTETTAFTAELTDLLPNTTYYVRAYATNEFGTGYGNQVSFKTEEIKIVYGPTVKDIDGNEYRSVVIGTQTWMLENLKVTKYNDGKSIATTQTNSEWNKLTNGGYCWHENNAANKTAFGAIYNWYAVNTGKLAPSGWHVPSNQEWETLMNHLGGIYKAGGKLKEAGTANWKSPNLATNETGYHSSYGRNSQLFWNLFKQPSHCKLLELNCIG